MNTDPSSPQSETSPSRSPEASDGPTTEKVVTFVAPRVPGQVSRVLVDDNNRVKKGDVLVELDPKPYQVQVAIKQSAVDAAQAQLAVTQANVRGLIGQARVALGLPAQPPARVQFGRRPSRSRPDVLLGSPGAVRSA
jgi:multidrug resistance efflux pump